MYINKSIESIFVQKGMRNIEHPLCFVLRQSSTCLLSLNHCSSMVSIEVLYFYQSLYYVIRKIKLSVSILIYFISTITVLRSVLGYSASTSWAFLMEVVKVYIC